MLSISNVGAAQASTYYNQDGYCARVENTQDRWLGSLKDELKLPDNITQKDFNNLIKENKERAGFDLCFSAPKSVSAAMILGEEIRQDICQTGFTKIRL